MDRLQAIAVFIAVAESGSFNRAAQRLRMSPPAVTRAVAALENWLGARVFQRTTRSLTITEAGRALLDGGRRVLAELDAVGREAAGDPGLPRGHLVVTASVTFGRSVLAPLVTDFLAAHPQVTAGLVLLDRVAHLVEEGIDVAVRIGHLPDSGLVARRIGAVRRILVASPNYLDSRGVPLSPAALREHAIIAFTGLMPGRTWRFQSGARAADVALAPRYEVNDALVAIQAATAGHGITQALSYMVAGELREGRLQAVLADYWLPPQPVHLVYPHAAFLPPRVRAFIDFVAPRLQTTLGGLESATAETPGF